MIGVAPAIDKLDTHAPSSTRSLLLRMASAVVLVPIVIGAVHMGGRAFAAVVAFASIVMIFEWTRMVERRAYSASFYVLALCSTLALFFAPSGGYLAAYGVCAFAGAAAFFLARRSGGLGFWPALAAPYILAPSIALIWLRLSVENGRALTLLLFIIVWAADTGAFITGKLIGGPKISHALSPSKTWAGIGGGVAAGVIAGALGAAYLIGPQAGVAFILFGGLLGGASVVGDLVESAFKRNFGLKDISGFIPGHGGALDRLDGMIFATAAMTSAYFLYMLAGNQ
mgnify:CR=1 FL=1